MSAYVPGHARLGGRDLAALAVLAVLIITGGLIVVTYRRRNLGMNHVRNVVAPATPGLLWLLPVAAIGVVLMVLAIRRHRRDGESLLPPMRFWVITGIVAVLTLYGAHSYPPAERYPHNTQEYLDALAIGFFVAALFSGGARPARRRLPGLTIGRMI